MRNTPFTGTMALVLLLAGCTADVGPGLTPTRSNEPKSVEGPEPQLASYPIIVRIVGRDQTITVSAAPGGTRVSAADGSGRTICRALTMDELRQREPGIYRQVQGQATATAADGAPVIDASVGAD